MTTIRVWVGLVLLTATLTVGVGCENRTRSRDNFFNGEKVSSVDTSGDTPVSGDGDPAALRFVKRARACLELSYQTATLDLNGETLSPQNEIIVVRNIPSPFISAFGYTQDGDESDPDLVWGVADKKIAAIKSATPTAARVTGLQDFFDTDGHEPRAIAGVCAIDECEPAPMVYPQDGCAGFTIVSLINLTGEWLVQGSMFAQPRHITLSQSGRQVTATPLLADQSRAELTDNILRFTPNHYQYVCTFTSRTHGDGKRIDVQTGISVGWWVADKVVAKD